MAKCPIRTSANIPADTIALVPPRREGESEADWATRCAVIKGLRTEPSPADTDHEFCEPPPGFRKPRPDTEPKA